MPSTRPHMRSRRVAATSMVSARLLGRLREAATLNDAKVLYRAAAMQNHPDLHPEKADDFLALQEAWECFETQHLAGVHKDQERKMSTVDTLEMVLFKLRSKSGLWGAQPLSVMPSAVAETILACGRSRFGASFEPAYVLRMDTSGPVLAIHVRATNPRHRELVAEVCGDTDSGAGTGGSACGRTAPGMNAAAKFAQAARAYRGPVSFLAALEAGVASADGPQGLSFDREGWPATYSSHRDCAPQEQVPK